MNNKRNKLFSWILLIGFFIPIGIGFVHSFEKHEYNYCHAKNEKHFHQYEQDYCSIFHYIIHAFIYDTTDINIQFQNPINTTVLWNTDFYCAVNIPYKSSRAPPIL